MDNGKIIFEDLTKPSDKEDVFKNFTTLLNLIALSKGLEMGLSYKEIVLAAFKTGEDLVNYGSLTNDIDLEDVESIKRKAKDLAKEKMEEVEQSGIAEVIKKYGAK